MTLDIAVFLGLWPAAELRGVRIFGINWIRWLEWAFRSLCGMLCWHREIVLGQFGLVLVG